MQRDDRRYCSICGLLLVRSPKALPQSGNREIVTYQPPPAASQPSPNKIHASQDVNNHKSSDLWFMKVWVYVVLPIFPLGILAVVLLEKNSLAALNGQQVLFIFICAQLIYGLHRKKIWAWYLNWIGIFALAAVPTKFGGAVGGAIGGLWICWNFVAWGRLKKSFTN